MRTARLLFAAAAIALVMPAAFAEDGMTGTVTRINRLNGTIAIRQVQAGTVGANAAGTAQEYKAKEAAMLDSVHAGDRVTFSTSETGGVRTLTKLQKQ